MISLGVLAAVTLLLAWLLASGRSEAPEPTGHRRVDESIDVSALEQAEREVQAADRSDAVAGWGPAVRPPIW